MTQQKLDLLKFASCCMAKPSAGSPKVVWRQLLDIQ